MSFHVVIAAQFIFLAPQRIRIIHLGFAIVMLLLLTPIARRDSLKKLRIFDIILAATAACVFIAVYVRYGALIKMGGRSQPVDIYLGVAAILLLYEVARRVISPGLIFLSLLAMLYVFLGNNLSGRLAHPGFSLSRVVSHLFLGGEGVFGFALGVSAEIIVIFVLFGAILQEVGIADYFNDLANALTGKQRGGPAKVAVVSSSLMGMVSGETSANVATTGAFTIPLMKKTGYSANFAGAVECAASAGGQILPPVMGATAFMLADTIGIPYIKLAIAAVLPAILYYVSVFSIVHFRAVRLDLKGSGDDMKTDWIGLLKRSYLVLPLAGIVVLLCSNYTPTFSAFWGGIVVAMIISFFSKKTRITPMRLIKVFTVAAKTVMSLSAATAVVGLIVGVFSLTGVSMTIARMIFAISGNITLLILFLTMIVTIILGMGLPTSAAYVLASISAVPALDMAGIDVLPAHLFVFYYGCMSTITPPVATGAYAAAGLSGGNPNSIGFISVRLAMAGFIVPFVFIYQPDLLIGENVNLALTVFTFLVTFVGVIYLSAACEGVFFEKVGTVKRLLYLAVALGMVWPDTLVSAVTIIFVISIFVVDLLQYRKKFILRRT
ncbi:MAG: TRAP transporter fused permease subunit [Synergistaceae bacterium]|nr:TRAP transporter fused permease subunit [Synergistaceae bacterium]